MADVADDVSVTVQHGETGNALVVHEQQRFAERAITIDGQDVFDTQIELPQVAWIELLHGGEALVVVPKKADEAQLT